MTVGVDLVHVLGFADQLAVPGTRFDSVFSTAERAEAAARGLSGERLAAYWAARWAAREALVKAWSSALFGQAPPYGDEVLGCVEVVTDAWQRPRLALRGEVARALAAYDVQLSISHDGEYAIAVVVLASDQVLRLGGDRIGAREQGAGELILDAPNVGGVAQSSDSAASR